MIDSYESVVCKFSGAGNDFVVLDGRKGGMDVFREPVRIGELCREYHTDGLMILDRSGDAPAGAHALDFKMEFYNPDGSGGMMCGNGGRCIVAFADYLGIRPADGKTYHFLAPDGPHTAEILAYPEETPFGGTPFASLTPAPPAASAAGPSPSPCAGVHMSSEGSLLRKWTVRLKMIDVQGVTPIKDGYFLNTGTRHFVKFTDAVDALDMEAVSKPLRWDAAFQPEGTNVNLVEVRPDGLHVRTYEKGVEGETLACGTGITASALAAWHAGVSEAERPEGAISYRLQCRRGDWLEVRFQPAAEDSFTDVYLTGPAELVQVTE